MEKRGRNCVKILCKNLCKYFSFHRISLTTRNHNICQFLGIIIHIDVCGAFSHMWHILAYLLNEGFDRLPVSINDAELNCIFQEALQEIEIYFNFDLEMSIRFIYTNDLSHKEKPQTLS